MKKQYVFLILIIIIFYFIYLITDYIYKDYKTNNNIEYIKELISEVEEKIENAKKIIEYKTSKAYKNKILKEQQSLKNNGEEVIYFTTEEEFNKYTSNNKKEEQKENNNKTDNLKEEIKDLSIYEKWRYFLFKIHPDKE